MPAFVLLFSYLLVGSEYFQDLKVFVGATLLNLMILTITFFTQNRISELITQRYEGLEHTKKRIVVSMIAHAIISGIFLLMVASLYVKFKFFGSTVTYRQIIIVYLINMAAIILVMGIQETFHSISRWRYHEVNQERLRKENVQGQLQSLKAQVSPHFLFNSLNSLSTLISEEPQKAEEFVGQMAKVYRYLLQTNQATDSESNADELTTLENELVFIESYYHLLKTRYGDGINLIVDVGQSDLHCRIPPLTLQLLVENAVKHNVIRSSRALTVEITSIDGGLLRVRNNLQKKTIAVGLENSESTQVGLANIRTKYQLLSQNQPGLAELTIEDGPKYFTVILPLLPKVSTII